MKLAVCFGGNKGLYLEKFAVRELVSEIADQKEKDVFICEGSEIRLFYSYGLRTSRALNEMKSENPHFLFPETSDVVISKIKYYNPDVVLFFGVAGSLSSHNVNEVVHPNHFLAYEFNHNSFIHEENISLPHRVSIHNLLKGSFERGSTILSTNVAIAPESCGVGRHVHLWKDNWSKVIDCLEKHSLHLDGKRAVDKYCELSFKDLLKKFNRFDIDFVEAESFAFASSFNMIGISLQVSDKPGSVSYKEHNLSRDVFKKQFLKAIKKVISL